MIQKTNEELKNKKAIMFDLKKANKFLFALIIILGLCYLAGANDLSIKGFKLQELKKEAREAGNENSRLELKKTSLGSYNNLSERVKTLGMVPAGKIDYLESGEEAVAVK